MRQFLAIILGACFLSLGTGVLEYLHNLQHEREDAAVMAMAGQPAGQSPRHDDGNCSIHAQLHLPRVASGWAPLLIFLGLFTAFLATLAPKLAPQLALARIDCRGPPAR